MSQKAYLEQLEEEVKNLLEQTRLTFANAPAEAHHLPPTGGGWSISECFAHLNAQFTYFLPRIELALHKAKARQWVPGEVRSSNWIGRSALSRVTSPKPLRSYKSMDPVRLTLGTNELKTFLIHTELLLRLVRQASEVDLNKARVKHFRWPHFQFMLGDLLEIMLRHAQRHAAQAENVYKSMRIQTGQ
jgi:DinB superfamily